MNKTLCPGQDMRFWRPGDIFDVDCGQCGTPVEFFKDEARRRCPKCGNAITNPRLSLGCAQWCEHAKECLGYDPQRTEKDVGQESALVDRLVSGLKNQLDGDQQALDRAFAVLGNARRILEDFQAEPKVVMAGALLHDLAGSDQARQIMEQSGMDRPSMLNVEQALGRLDADEKIDTPEFVALRDALMLTRLDDDPPLLESGASQLEIDEIFKSESGRLLARAKLQRSA